jgi:hypothetical protein
MRERKVFLLASLCLLFCARLYAASVSGVVKDPSGAVVAGAAVSLEPLPRGTALQTTTDAQGVFRFDGTPAGSYNMAVTKTGFEPWNRAVTLAGKPLNLGVSLRLKLLTETVTVSGKRSSLANSDPNYLAVRGGKLTKVYRVNNLALTRDVGIFTFRSGSFSFLPPVLGQVVTGVFVGDGNFQLKPSSEMAVKHLRLIAGKDSVEEDFTAMVVYFTDSTFDEIKQHAELADESPIRHEAAFGRVKDLLEQRRDPSRLGPLTALERLLTYEDIPNYDAEVLAELYNPAQRGSFRAFLHGREDSDLRFLMNPRGAMPMLAAPEETALLNFDPRSSTDGIWYLSHLASELRSGQASSNEDKRLIAPEHYRIEAFARNQDLIGKNPELVATCDLRFRSLDEGTRMIEFDLFPDLQVSRVVWNGAEIPFIQESRSKDGSFYLQMPEPLVKGQTYQVTFDYAGGEILQSQFGQVPLRRVWYPTPAGPASRATYNLSFHIPRGATIVSVGKPASQTRDGAFDISEWSSEVPIMQAVFHIFDRVTSKTTIDQATRMELAAYVNEGPAVSEPANDTLIGTGNAVRIFQDWFGPPAYKHLSIVVGRGYDSLPGFVYTSPGATAGYGSAMTQALEAYGEACVRSGCPPGGSVGPPLAKRTSLDEAFAVQISQQWWGNTVGPVSFHDMWLSSGFANFSASVYDLAVNPEEVGERWDRTRDAILHPPARSAGFCIYCSAIRPNDTGPLWMGILNDTSRTQTAGNILSTHKGGYVLNMLRWMMWDGQEGDTAFRAMMKDFVKKFANQAVSTEDFKSLVEKHMKPAMDMDGNHRMDWFFREWVYGIDIPSYRLEYSLAAEGGGKWSVSGKLTQSGVSPGFKMLVPFFAEYGNKKSRIGVASMHGNSSAGFKVTLNEQPKRILLNLNHDVLTDKEEVKLMK